MNAQIPMFGDEPAPETYRSVPVRSHMRRMRGDTPQTPRPTPTLTGRQLRDTAIAAHERNHSAWLAEVRREAIRVAFEHGTVCADDIAHIPLPEGASPNVRGAVFNCREFVFVGFVRSKRPEAHANRLNSYTLATHTEDRYGS